MTFSFRKFALTRLVATSSSSFVANGALSKDSTNLHKQAHRKTQFTPAHSSIFHLSIRLSLVNIDVLSNERCEGLMRPSGDSVGSLLDSMGAQVVKLVDTQRSERCARKGMEVQILSWAQKR